MDILDPDEWPLSAAKIAKLCEVDVRTAQRWLSGEHQAPRAAIKLIHLTQRQRILPDTWPNHWRITDHAMDIGHPKIALSPAMINHYFYSIHMWRAMRDLLPEIEARIEYLHSRLPVAEVIDLAKYRDRLREFKERQFYELSNYSK